MATTVLPVKCMRTVILTCLLSLTALHGAVAQEAVVDPPSRVARLSYLEGEVSLAPAGTQEWAEAVLNRPLTTGDRVWVDQGARAELQLGSVSVHLDQGSGFSFVDLDDDLLHMQLTDGAATIRVQRKRDNERLEIDTPNTLVALLHPGEYHIEVTAAGDTVVKTRSGEVEVQGENSSYAVRAGEVGVFAGTTELSADINPLGPRTAFEDWANDRDRRDEDSMSARYVSPEVIGYEDLDRDGEWISEPDYGYVWRPTYVAAGWAPYRYGRWVWVSPWGWNWIDDARWGFAPSHYGRWAYLRSRWCWVPGPRHIRPVYAPALVAWTGSAGFNVSVSFGSGVGWFPLGPRELYVPGYRYSRRYLHDVNVSNTFSVNNTRITNIYNGRGGRFNYRYGHDTRAVTVVEQGRFVAGRSIDGHYSRPSERDLRRWQPNARPPAIAPERDSVLAARRVAARPVSTRGEHARLADRAERSRISFAAERQAIVANNGRPIGRSQLLANPAMDSRLNSQRNSPLDSRSQAGPQPGMRAAREPRVVDEQDVRADRPDRALRDDRLGGDRLRGDGSMRREQSRSLDDRPTWARQRDASPRRESQAQRATRPEAGSPGARSDRVRENVNRRHMPQPAATVPTVAPPATTLGGNERRDNQRRSNERRSNGQAVAPSIREESVRQWRGDNTAYRVQRGQRASQDSTALRDRGNRGDVLDQRRRSDESGPDRGLRLPAAARPVQSVPPAQPRYSTPREQPRAQRQQAERVAPPQRARSEQRSQHNDNSQRSGQPRSFGRPSQQQRQP